MKTLVTTFLGLVLMATPVFSTQLSEYCDKPTGHLNDPEFGDVNGRILLTITKVNDNSIAVIVKPLSDDAKKIDFLQVNVRGLLPVIVGVDEGDVLDALKVLLDTTPTAKVIYVIPDFQNPTGRTWSLERRKGLMERCQQYNVVIVEDNHYGEVRFEGEYLPSLQAFDTLGQVICLGTFSKTFCPGYRIGWVAASEEILKQYVVVKQGADLQCNTIAQREIAK